tara:strand:+ start:9208 stop:9414 length:207 start_codon:yes stop_codon:yes gene_type:complete
MTDNKEDFRKIVLSKLENLEVDIKILRNDFTEIRLLTEEIKKNILAKQAIDEKFLINGKPSDTKSWFW